MTALKPNHEREGNPARVSPHTGSASTFSHYEISLLLFALQGGNAAPMPDASECEEACPVIESVEELLCGGSLDREQQLVRHLNNHLREALIECGLFEFMASHSREGSLSNQDQAHLEQANARLMRWSCDIKLDREDRGLLLDSLSRLPRSSWLTMPRTMWRLRRNLKRPSRDQ
ncbi:MAG TPA: hypothetical protein VN743_05855 [Blastocatellia bacterium]|nr:hypothetical protein [Blastocatellia bacterium]